MRPLEKTLLLYILTILLLLGLAWGVNAIAAANPVRSTTLPLLDQPLVLPTLVR